MSQRTPATTQTHHHLVKTTPLCLLYLTAKDVIYVRLHLLAEVALAVQWVENVLGRKTTNTGNVQFQRTRSVSIIQESQNEVHIIFEEVHTNQRGRTKSLIVGPSLLVCVTLVELLQRIKPDERVLATATTSLTAAMFSWRKQEFDDVGLWYISEIIQGNDVFLVETFVPPPHGSQQGSARKTHVCTRARRSTHAKILARHHLHTRHSKSKKAKHTDHREPLSHQPKVHSA
mmetsp:Transcript_12609/g.34894  ORF Transcript_12609/g.34894 Transcript_12609/m.34894 type:complete len:231 (+) Transcript_12609:620-1312(+)